MYVCIAISRNVPGFDGTICGDGVLTGIACARVEGKPSKTTSALATSLGFGCFFSSVLLSAAKIVAGGVGSRVDSGFGLLESGGARSEGGLAVSNCLYSCIAVQNVHCVLHSVPRRYTGACGCVP